MRDPVFRQALADSRAERGDLLKRRGAVTARMVEMIEDVKARLKTDDLDRVKAELEKDPEWNSLYKRCLDANQAIKENRQKTLAVVRERITPAKSAPVRPTKEEVSK